MRLNLDHNFYKKMYPELKDLTNHNLEKHYKLYGSKERRIININEFLKQYPQFNYRWYIENIRRDIQDCIIYYYNVIINIKKKNFYIGKPIITFILPTIGREHLIKSINSVYQQTVSNWNLIVLFDGMESTIKSPRLQRDQRINILNGGPKLGKIKKDHNNAGDVRNRAFKWVQSEWIGFIDDDDLLERNYIESLLLEIETDPSLELIIFRMRHCRNNDLIVPPLECNQIIKNQVGISFCFRRDLLERYDLKFNNDEHEDYLFLIDMIKRGVCYKLSEKIVYIFK